MIHAGLTGGIGSGKSAVAAMFASLGARVLDADVLARALTGPGSETAATVERELGPGLLTADGALDRDAVARLVFADAGARERLGALLHPRIVERRREILREIRGADCQPAVVISEASLIFEAGTRGEFDRVILVTAPREIRLARLEARGMVREEAQLRMESQWPDERKLPLADFVVDNGGDLDRTRAQVASLWNSLCEGTGHG